MAHVLGASLLIAGISLVYLALSRRQVVRFRSTEASQDRPVEPILQFGYLGGKDGSVRIKGLYVVSAYADGLRVSVGVGGIGLLGHSIFTPWENLAVIRTWTIFGQRAQLYIGSPVTIIVPNYVADALASIARDRWPESGPIRKVTWRDVALSLLWEWIVMSLSGAAFFCAFFGLVTFVEGGRGPSLLFPFLFPSIPFGVFWLFRFFIECRSLRSHVATVDNPRSSREVSREA